MSFQPVGLQHVDIDGLPAIAVGPGCTRYDLPSRDGVRIWVVDIAAGATWPRVDEHDALGEDIVVLSGELIEGDDRFGPGTFVHFGPDSRHQPSSEKGVRLFGFNLIGAAV